MRITKEKAEFVAKKLTEKKMEKRQELINELKEYCTDIAVLKIPKEVIDVWKKHEKYINLRNYINIEGSGIDNYDLKRQDVVDYMPTDERNISVTKKESDYIQKMTWKINDMYNECRQLRREIENAVYNLRTYAKCEKEFPEAFKLLPKQAVSTALAVNINDIRNKINNK